MRTFPGVWVPPGGGVEAGDAAMIDAAVRELREETGVAVRPEEGRAARILGLWGSKVAFHISIPHLQRVLSPSAVDSEPET